MFINLRIVSWESKNLSLSSIISAHWPITSFEADGRSYSILGLARFLPKNVLEHSNECPGGMQATD